MGFVLGSIGEDSGLRLKASAFLESKQVQRKSKFLILTTTKPESPKEISSLTNDSNNTNNVTLLRSRRYEDIPVEFVLEVVKNLSGGITS